jgi:hypothetical protein
MSRQTGLILGVALLAALGGAGAMQLVRVAFPPAPAPVPEPRTVIRTTANSALQTAALGQAEMLRRQTAALEQERDRLQSERATLLQTLADRDRELARLQPAAPVAARTNAPADGGRRRESFEDRLAQMQREEPERFAEMQKQREEFRQRIQTQATERTDFLKRIETANMTEAQRANHEQLLLLTEQARLLIAQMPNLPHEEADQARRQLFESYGTLSKLYEQERRYLLEATAQSVGYKDQEAAQFADQIQLIYDQTTLVPGFGRGGGGRGGRNGRDGNTPPPPPQTVAPAAP